MADLFGFEIRRKKDLESNTVVSFTPPSSEDGVVNIIPGGMYGTYVDLEGTVRSEAELITRYREMSITPEIDAAIVSITNEAIVADSTDNIVSIVLDNTNLSDTIKPLVEKEFKNILELMDFENHAYDIFRRWYIDGRLYYHIMIDEKAPQEGIKELRYIDARKIRKIREIKRPKPIHNTQVFVTDVKAEYFIFNDRGFTNSSVMGNAALPSAGTSGLKISKDSILHVSSGLTDQNGLVVLSYLHKAIKIMNQMRMMEDATVIYRISRAPERRIFYVDVGNLPKMKAEQYINEMMTRHKNRLVYDAGTGEIRDDRRFMTMLEDYWLPRREGNRTTEITTLPGGQNLGVMDDVIYFQRKLFTSLNVPVSRLDPEAQYAMSVTTDITREELVFSKFIKRLRNKFSSIFTQALGKQLILKGIFTIEDWEAIKNRIRYEYSRDSYFEEIKEGEILKNRINIVSMIEPYVGKYVSNEWVRKNVLRQTDDDIGEITEQIMQEQSNPLYYPPAPPMPEPQQ